MLHLATKLRYPHARREDGGAGDTTGEASSPADCNIFGAPTSLQYNSQYVWCPRRFEVGTTH
eukprot:SAG31_NODE_1570_length_7854_cov_2.292328_2_plen_62_part_00